MFYSLKIMAPNSTRQRDSVNVLYDDSVGAILLNIFCVTAVVFGFNAETQLPFKYAWAGIFYVLLGARLIDTFYWHSKLKSILYAPAWPKLRFVFGAVAAAAMWSVYSVVVYPNIELLELAILLVVLAGLSGGAATVFSGSKKLSIFYSVILLTPVSIMMTLSVEPSQNVIGVLGIFFTILLVLASIRAANFTTSSIELINRNELLVEEMAKKNDEISNINHLLEEKVESRTQEILSLSNVDPLTSLFNRKAFSKNLGEILNNCKVEELNLALLFIDLEGFKSVNDTQGHSTGDKVLVAVAQRLMLFAKGPQHICRWGGDEFIIVVEDVNANEAIDFGRDIIKSVSQLIHVDLSRISVGATIGVSMFPEHGKEEAELISLADTAMYKQKDAATSDVCVFSHEMLEEQVRERFIRDALARALYNNEFHLVYQPVINNETNEVSFCEVLLRWNLNGQLVSPQEFIPIAEQYGFIHDIGEWVLMTSCSEVKNWIFDDSVDISVNVSVAQIMRTDFLGIAQNVLAASGLPSKKLHLEITESIFAGDTDTMLANIKAIQKLGIKVSVDDFGTGFSSLCQLQKLSADIVKIDQSFIASMHDGGQAIIQATQFMAGKFGYSVVAEGVETKEQADELSNLGITCSQGYYFSQPMIINDLPVWYEKFKQNKENASNPAELPGNKNDDG